MSPQLWSFSLVLLLPFSFSPSCSVLPFTKQSVSSGILAFHSTYERPLLMDWMFVFSQNYYLCAQLLGCVWLFVRLWPTRLIMGFSWDFQSKNTGVGCHFLLQNSYIEAPSVSLFGSEASEEVIKCNWYSHLNAEFQIIARRDKKAFLSNQCKEIEENNRMGKTIS